MKMDRIVENIGRREFLGLSGLAGFLSGRQSLADGAVPENRAARPDIVLLIADDVGWNDVGYHGSEIPTPNIGRLAREGVELDRFYACPTCSPTRAAILMGRPPSRFGILEPIAGRSALSLPENSVTLASVLGNAGYRTVQIGKWHLGLTPDTGPNRYGFEHSYGYLHGQIDPYTHIYKNGDRSWHQDGRFTDENGHATDLIATRAINQLETSGTDRPLLLYVAFSVPHYPLDEPEQWMSPLRGRIADPSRLMYAAAMCHMDDAVGKILAAAERNSSRRGRSTLILWVSDNGGQDRWDATAQEYGGKYKPNEVLGNNHPLRGWKTGLYEGGIRVPAAAFWPGVLERRKVDIPIHAMDLLPTLAAAAETEIPTSMQIEGKNILSVLAGSKPEGDRTFYWNTGRQLAVMRGFWKLIQQDGVLNAGKTELYNVESDPGEKIDLAGSQETRVTQLRAVLAAQMSRDSLPGPS